MSDQQERPSPVETKLRTANSASRLPEASTDSVFDGRNMRLAFLENDLYGARNTSEQKQERIEQLANMLNSNDSILGHTITPQEIQEIPQKMQELLMQPDGKYAGVYMSVGGMGRDVAARAEFSALLTIIMSDYILQNPETTPQDAMKLGVLNIKMLASIYRDPSITMSPELALAYVGRDGSLTSVESENTRVVIASKDGGGQINRLQHSAEDFLTIIPPEDNPRLAAGDKVVLCVEGAVDKIDGSKNVEEIVNTATDATHVYAAAAGETADNSATLSPVTLRPIEGAADVQAAVGVIGGETNDAPTGTRLGTLLAHLRQGIDWKQPANETFVERTKRRAREDREEVATIGRGIISGVKKGTEVIGNAVRRGAEEDRRDEGVPVAAPATQVTRSEPLGPNEFSTQDGGIGIGIAATDKSEVTPKTTPKPDEVGRNLLDDTEQGDGWGTGSLDKPAVAAAGKVEPPQRPTPLPAADVVPANVNVPPVVIDRPPQPPVQSTESRVPAPPESTQGKERVIIVDMPGGKRVSVLEYQQTAEYQKTRAIVDKILQPDGAHYNPRILDIVPRGGESNEEYQIKVFTQLEKELRDLTHPKYDPHSLFNLFYAQNEVANIAPEQLLTVAEASNKILQHGYNQQFRTQSVEQLRAHFRTAERTSEVLTEVGMRGSVRVAEGPYMSSFESRGVRAPEVEADKAAFLFLEDYLGNNDIGPLLPEINQPQVSTIINDLKLHNKPSSYREVIAEVRRHMDGATTPEERFTYREVYARVRREFYNHMEDALEHRVSTSLEAVSPYTRNLIGQLNALTLTPGAMEQALQHFQGMARTDKGNQAVTDRLRNILLKGNNQSLLFMYGLKGAEYFKRMAKDPIKVPGEVDLTLVVEKKQIQGPRQPVITPPRGTPTPPAARPPVPPVTGNQPPGENPPARPPVVDNPQPPIDAASRVDRPPGQPDGPNGPGELPPAPGQGREGEGGRNLEPAPPGEQPPEKPRQQEDEPPPRTQETPPGEKKPLATRVTIGIAGLKNAAVENTADMTMHSFAHDLTNKSQNRWYKFRDKVFGFTYKIPILGGAIRSAVHPIQMIWQNGIARTVFTQQHARFAVGLKNIIKDAVGDRSIPFEVNNTLIDKAYDGGRQMYGSQNVLKRFGWSVRSFVTGVTGIGQNKEQIFAKRWVKEQLDNNAIDTWSTVLGMDFNSKKILSEQAKIGDRFAQIPAGMTLDQANRLILSHDAGETRKKLDLGDRQPEVNRQVKNIIEKYASGTIDALQFTKEVNTYFRDLAGTVGGDFAKDIQHVPEIASSMLTLADDIKAEWARYKSEKTPNGQTVWDEWQVTEIMYGNGVEGGKRGRHEVDFITENLLRRLVNREFSFGNGILAGAGVFFKDAITFGGSYAGGVILSGALFGGNTAARVVGGIAGVGAVAGLKESGLRIAGIGFTGRYAKEVFQASQDAAIGRETPATARIRKEMERVLVNRVGVGELTKNINDKMKEGQQMSEAEARTLLAEIAKAQARVRLTDLSNTRAMNYQVQNFIQYTEGNEEAEKFALKSAITNGISRLATSPIGAQLFTAAGGYQYGQNNANLGMFDKYTVLVEAQLRESSDAQIVRKWLGDALKLQKPEVDEMIRNLYPDVNIAVKRGEDLRSKQRTLRNLSIKRGVTVAVQTMIASPLAGLSMVAPLAAAHVVIPEIQHLTANGLTLDGFNHHIQDWGKVIHGDIPIKDVNGHPVADLTPLEKTVLYTRAVVEPPVWPVADIPLHHEKIDNVDVNLSPWVRHQTLANGNEFFVDVRTAQVSEMNGMHFTTVTSGSTTELMLTDNHGTTIPVNAPSSPLHSFTVEHGTPLTATQEVTTLPDTNRLVDQTVTVDGHNITTKIPEHTVWKQDSGHWNLVTTGSDGKDLVLIQNAHFDANGKIDRTDSVNSHLTLMFNAGETKTSVVNGSEAVVEWDKHGHAIDHREWYSYDKPGSQGNELLFKTAYDPKTSTVTLDMSGMHTATQSGLQPNPIDVQQVIKNNEAGFAFSLPGHEGKPVWVPAPGGQIHLNPHDNTSIAGANMTIGQLTTMLIDQKELKALDSEATSHHGDIATELYHHQNIFKLGVDGKHGYIEAGRLTHSGNVMQTFATITGSGAVGVEHQVSGGGAGVPVIDLKEAIHETKTIQTQTYVLTPPPVSLFTIPHVPLVPYINVAGAEIPVIPAPGRMNIERSESKGAAAAAAAVTKTEDEEKKKEKEKNTATDGKAAAGKPTTKVKPAPSEEEKQLVAQIAALQAEIKALTDKQNPTDEEKALLVEKKKQFDEVATELQKIKSKSDPAKVAEYKTARAAFLTQLNADIAKVAKGELKEEEFEKEWGKKTGELKDDKEKINAVGEHFVKMEAQKREDEFLRTASPEDKKLVQEAPKLEELEEARGVNRNEIYRQAAVDGKKNNITNHDIYENFIKKYEGELKAKGFNDQEVASLVTLARIHTRLAIKKGEDRQVIREVENEETS